MVLHICYGTFGEMCNTQFSLKGEFCVESGKNICVYLPFDMIEEAKKLGDGSLSRGLRRMWRDSKTRQPGVPLTPLVYEKWRNCLEQYVARYPDKTHFPMCELWAVLECDPEKLCRDDSILIFKIMGKLGFTTFYRGSNPKAAFHWLRTPLKESTDVGIPTSVDEDFPY